MVEIIISLISAAATLTAVFLNSWLSNKNKIQAKKILSEEKIKKIFLILKTDKKNIRYEIKGSNYNNESVDLNLSSDSVQLKISMMEGESLTEKEIKIINAYFNTIKRKI